MLVMIPKCPADPGAPPVPIDTGVEYRNPPEKRQIRTHHLCSVLIGKIKEKCLKKGLITCSADLLLSGFALPIENKRVGR